MLQRPLYQTAIAACTLVSLTGAVFFLVSPSAPPGVEITLAPTPASAPVLPDAQLVAAVDGLLNINTASAADLAAGLPGVGPVLSQRIVAYRQANGPFVRTDQLMAVEGIGTATFERIRHLVTVD